MLNHIFCCKRKFRKGCVILNHPKMHCKLQNVLQQMMYDDLMISGMPTTVSQRKCKMVVTNQFCTM